MPRSLFLDTSALFAYLSPREERHQEARLLYEAALVARRSLSSSTDIFSELVTLVRSRAGTAHAIHVGDTLRSSQAIRFLPVGEDIHESAWAIFRSRRWPGLSFTDCTSSALMTSHGIDEVFTFDDDFRKLGHDTLPAPKPLLKPRRPRRG